MSYDNVSPRDARPRREPAAGLFGILLAFAGCVDAADGVAVLAPPDLLPVARSFVEHLGDERVRVREAGGPAPPGGEVSLQLTLAADLDCGECYRIERSGSGYTIHGGGVLGVQYGLAHALEDRGFRFFHPWRSHAPKTVGGVLSSELVGRVFAPEMAVRGIQLHTLHPIEALYAYWIPGEENLAAALRINDWLVKNRANYVQWVTLADIIAAEATRRAWEEHSREIIDDAHRRGLQTGVNVQLFSSGNLQQAFDLVDAKAVTEGEARTAMERRVSLLLALPFDQVCLSFGEFFGEEPQRFIDTVNLAYEVIQEQRPGLEVSAVIHVGDEEDLRVQYDGEEMIYYFLVKHTDPAIVPWVHTVMYYNLFDDAGGAYHHEDFADHRAFLLERLRAGKRAVYFPESAYWVAFDVSIPTYVPLYVLSRWRDISQLARLAPGGEGLLEQVIFSSGWEWGYWQNDYAVLRAGFQLPSSWEDIFVEMFAALGEQGRALADQIIAVAKDQHEFLIGRRLAPYLAGEDAVIEMGARLGIVSQPARHGLSEVAEWDGPARDRFRGQVIAPLAELRRRTEHALEQASALDLDSAWVQEVIDGLAVNAQRARFIHAVYSGALARVGSPEAQQWIETAEIALAAATEVVRRRHANLHHPDASRLTRSGINPTLYQYGYLKMADDLCYWQRELTQLRNLAAQQTAPVPDCFLD